MIDLSTTEWKTALQLVRTALEDGTESARAAAFDFLRTAESKRLIGLAHLLQPGTTPRAIQAALVPLERVDTRAKVTDAEMGIRSTDRPATARPDETVARPAFRFTAVADNIRSAFNAGGLFRTADFFGAERLILCGYTPDPSNAQVKKTALGADETVPWEKAGDIRDVIDRLRRDGYTIYALETVDGALNLATAPLKSPCALLLGNERFGLDPDVIASADAVLEIPSHGTKNSLNVVSAFAIAGAFLRRPSLP